jgi:hypothetical protein
MQRKGYVSATGTEGRELVPSDERWVVTSEPQDPDLDEFVHCCGQAMAAGRANGHCPASQPVGSVCWVQLLDRRACIPRFEEHPKSSSHHAFNHSHYTRSPSFSWNISQDVRLKFLRAKKVPNPQLGGRCTCITCAGRWEPWPLLWPLSWAALPGSLLPSVGVEWEGRSGVKSRQEDRVPRKVQALLA